MTLRFACVIAVLILAGFALAQEPAATKPAADSAKATPKTPTTVKLIVNTSPRKRAWVYYGKKKLGLTPFELELPYDSGPRDVVVKAKGFIPVNTRFYTLKDEKVIVSLTREEDAHLLFGYREEIPPDAGVSGAPDAGAPAPTVTPSGSLATPPAPATPTGAAPAGAPTTPPAPSEAPATPE